MPLGAPHVLVAAGRDPARRPDGRPIIPAAAATSGGGSMSVRSTSRWLARGSDPESLVMAAEGPPAGLAEVFVHGKNDTIGCEDIVVVTPRHVAVLDGMSSP